jgi:hypothetical protein
VSLYQLLYNISQGKPINLDSLHKALPKNIKANDIFGNNEMVAKNKYILNVIDQTKFDVLLAQSKAPVTRTEAASHVLQSSHYIACDSAYMLSFPVHAECFDELEPDDATAISYNSSTTNIKSLSSRTLMPVASVRSHILPMQFTPAKSAILVENQDCFFDWQRLMRHFSSSVNAGECDIYFAGGKRILNPALAPFLRQYESLYCAFDYDLDGLKIAKSLLNKQYADTQILIPDKLTQLSTLFTFKPASTQRFLDSLQQCDDMNLPELREVISATQHFMEQEALLSVIEPA